MVRTVVTTLRFLMSHMDNSFVGRLEQWTWQAHCTHINQRQTKSRTNSLTCETMVDTSFIILYHKYSQSWATLHPLCTRRWWSTPITYFTPTQFPTLSCLYLMPIGYTYILCPYITRNHPFPISKNVKGARTKNVLSLAKNITKFFKDRFAMSYVMVYVALRIGLKSFAQS